jgi:hypothetical protein
MKSKADLSFRHPVLSRLNRIYNYKDDWLTAENASDGVRDAHHRLGCGNDGAGYISVTSFVSDSVELGIRW